MRARLLACLALARLAAAPWITPCQTVLLKQLRVDKRANLAATECSERALYHATLFWLVADRRRNVVLTGIPKAGITSIRSALNRKCFMPSWTNSSRRAGVADAKVSSCENAEHGGEPSRNFGLV